MTAGTYFGYRHVSGIPLCPCRDPGNYVTCEALTDPLAFRLVCWCGRSIQGTWDDEADKLAFLQRVTLDRLEAVCETQAVRVNP